MTAVNNGRHDPRLAGSVGMFVKTLPVYLQFSDDESVSAYLKRTQEMLFDEMKHDCIAFGELATHYGVTADVSFVYQAELLSGAATKDGALEVRPLETGNTQFDLTVMVLKGAGGYELSVDYRTELYSRRMMLSFADMLGKVVSELMTAGKIGDIDPLTRQAALTLDGFNRTDAPYDADRTVIDLFRDQAKQAPDNVAVVYEDVKVTYGELDALTDILAKNLRAMGVGREKVVAVLIPRCEYIAIASLGVLKAGGGYLPLDPTYPPDRLNLMVKDSGAMLLITTPELNGVITDEFTGRRVMLDDLRLHRQAQGRDADPGEPGELRGRQREEPGDTGLHRARPRLPGAGRAGHRRRGCRGTIGVCGNSRFRLQQVAPYRQLCGQVAGHPARRHWQSAADGRDGLPGHPRAQGIP